MQLQCSALQCTVLLCSNEWLLISDKNSVSVIRASSLLKTRLPLDTAAFEGRSKAFLSRRFHLIFRCGDALPTTCTVLYSSVCTLANRSSITSVRLRSHRSANALELNIESRTPGRSCSDRADAAQWSSGSDCFSSSASSARSSLCWSSGICRRGANCSQSVTRSSTPRLTLLPRLCAQLQTVH